MAATQPAADADGAISSTLASDYGEEAARFLTRSYHEGELDTIEARIRGIRDLDIVQQLLEAEAAMARRQGVVALLNRRKRLLEQNPDQARPIEELPTRDGPRDLPEKTFVVVDENGEPYDRTRSAAERVAALRSGGGGDA